MPIYEYLCDACGSMRELILKSGESARPNCPGCRKRMRRVISPTSFVLKGKGWYVTDYPSDARKKGLEAETAPAPAAAPAPAEGGAKKEAPAAEKKPAPAKETAGGAKGAKKRR